uniref:Uncharacterized protein n=1 Tax=Syphacia muris TaxID=451379 RepID=A0A0N5ANN8_9BILA
MLGIMNNVSFESGTGDLYAAPKRTGQQPIFDGVSKKLQIAYLKDGRKVISGKISNVEGPQYLWSDLIKKSVASKLCADISKNENQSENITDDCQHRNLNFQPPKLSKQQPEEKFDENQKRRLL